MPSGRSDGSTNCQNIQSVADIFCPILLLPYSQEIWLCPSLSQIWHTTLGSKWPTTQSLLTLTLPIFIPIILLCFIVVAKREIPCHNISNISPWFLQSRLGFPEPPNLLVESLLVRNKLQKCKNVSSKTSKFSSDSLCNPLFSFNSKKGDWLVSYKKVRLEK